ncbi:hypothetical protein IGI65_000726 [Enterococcus sp. DIV0755b]|uniref:hypothetical protein n=1 Tax=Enterococcus sp. DIV0755b TaxID=2774657 RepID=UPI003F22E8A7
MTEAIVIGIFLALLLVIQIKDQKEIVILAKRNTIKIGLTLTLAVSILIIFWPQQLADQIKLSIFAILIASVGVLKEGLTPTRLIKFGVLIGDYKQFEAIQLEDSRLGETFITFYKGKNTHFSTLFRQDIKSIEHFFKQNGLENKIVIGEMPGEKVMPKSQKQQKSSQKKLGSTKV